MKTILIIMLLACWGGVNAQELTLVIDITNFKNDHGTAHVSLQDSNKQNVRQANVTIENNSAQATFNNLFGGKYAVKVFHDENNNEKLDRGLLGIPVEGWGASNNPKRGFGPPKFRNMLFDLQENKEIQIRLKK